MSNWVHDRKPTDDELKDYDLTFVTIEKDSLGTVTKFVRRMSGFMIKAYFGGQWQFTETIVAWMPIPNPWDEAKEAEETARLLMAMRSGDDAKLRECLG